MFADFRQIVKDIRDAKQLPIDEEAVKEDAVNSAK